MPMAPIVATLFSFSQSMASQGAPYDRLTEENTGLVFYRWLCNVHSPLKSAWLLHYSLVLDGPKDNSKGEIFPVTGHWTVPSKDGKNGISIPAHRPGMVLVTGQGLEKNKSGKLVTRGSGEEAGRLIKMSTQGKHICVLCDCSPKGDPYRTEL